MAGLEHLEYFGIEPVITKLRSPPDFKQIHNLKSKRHMIPLASDSVFISPLAAAAKEALVPENSSDSFASY